jgi:hypothetical protein
MGRACNTNGGKDKILVGKSEGKRPLGIPRHRWMNILKWILERERMDWCGLN